MFVLIGKKVILMFKVFVYWVYDILIPATAIYKHIISHSIDNSNFKVHDVVSLATFCLDKYYLYKVKSL